MDKAEDEIDRALANSSDTSSSWESSSEESDYVVEDSRITEDDGQSEPPRTLHEVTEIQIPTLPENFEMTDQTAIQPIGHLFSASDNLLVIQANNSGRYRVLADGTIFCLGDRTVLGVLYETFGPVDQPFYVVLHKKTEEFAANVGKEVFFVVPGSHYELTQTFQVKGSDASNWHDEEVALEDQEFSDDEQEALAKRKKKKRPQHHSTKQEAAPSTLPPTTLPHEAMANAWMQYARYYEQIQTQPPPPPPPY